MSESLEKDPIEGEPVEKKSFGEVLRMARQRRGLTQKAVSSFIRISRRYLRKIEGGKEPGRITLGKLIKFYGEDYLNSISSGSAVVAEKVPVRRVGKREHAGDYGIGAALRKLRGERGLTLKEVSEQVGVSAAQISKVESGEVKYSSRVLVKLMRFYGAEHLVFTCADAKPQLRCALGNPNPVESASLTTDDVSTGGVYPVDPAEFDADAVTEKSAPVESESDPVNHPAHYTFGKYEVIDVLEDWGLDLHLGNAVKYIARAGRKDPAKTIEDLGKAVWYLRRKIGLLQRGIVE